MQGLPGTITTAAGLFAVTNIDGLIVLTALFLTSARGGLRAWQIVVGQYLGFTAMIVLSLLASAGLLIVPNQWVGLVGLVPLAFGLWGLLNPQITDDEGTSLIAGNLSSVVLLIVANGVDNISVYTPLFAAEDVAQIAVTVGVFLVLVALWCAVARLLGGNKRAVAALVRSGRWLVPVVFIVIGVAILIRTGVLYRLISML